ncbi:MAG TPA: nucleotide pyrophosphohydrolase [Thermoprotei archaeon]|nr:nucleotide pyrophosphohydrolase [Thermoprotei archaeon]
MDLKELQSIQRRFDLEYFPEFWRIMNYEDFLDRLEYITVALAGEIGEFANIVKKMRREYLHVNRERRDYLDTLKEELTDIFIYVLIASNLLDMDIEEWYTRKSNINRDRFKKYKDDNL